VLETSCEASAGPAGASIPQRGSDAATRPGPGVRTSASPSAAPASVDRLQFVVEDQRRPSSSEWRSESDTFAGAKRSLSIRSAPVRSQRSARGRWIVCRVVDVQRRRRAAARGQLHSPARGPSPFAARTGSFAAQRQGPVDRLQGRRRAAPSSSGGARPATLRGAAPRGRGVSSICAARAHRAPC